MNASGLNALAASNNLFSRMHMAVLHLWLVFVCIWSYRLLQGVVDRYRSMHSFGCLTLNVINQSIYLSTLFCSATWCRLKVVHESSKAKQITKQTKANGLGHPCTQSRSRRLAGRLVTTAMQEQKLCIRYLHEGIYL